MKTFPLVVMLAFVLSAIALSGCANSHRRPLAQPERTVVQPTAEALREIEAGIDQLCQYTGLRRSGQIDTVMLWRKNNRDYAYNADLQLMVDGSSCAFIVRLDSHFRVLTFEPKSFDLSDLNEGIGYNTVKDRVVRERCVGSVNRLNEYLRWTWYGRPAIQKIGSNFIVTYETVSPAESKKRRYYDPYVSFVVTHKGTLLKVFFGA